ncbi:hypothetical protein PO124_02260 [Bacillus licheniformis]|nr:hypothetical protein [Bacillus licheniformis]
MLQAMLEHDVKNRILLDGGRLRRALIGADYRRHADNADKHLRGNETDHGKLMKRTEEAHGISFVSLRYFNVAGARETGEIGEDHRPETHLVPSSCRPLSAKDRI